MTLFKYKEKVDILINQYISRINDEEIKKMLSYALIGGKRLRSIITLYIFENLGNINNDVVVAIELLHNASLILDDLPCMDNDDFRRNKLSFHKKFGLKNAYLISNYLFSEFNRIIKNLNNDDIFKYVIENLRLIIIGQYYDLFPKNNSSNIEKRISNNNLKTTPFFVLSFYIPLILCCKEINLNIVETIGTSFSTSFQIYDDFLDFEQDKKTGNFNHINLLGKEKSYNLYLKNFQIFRNNIKKLNIKIELFEEIINYLNKKLQIHHNELQL